MGQIFQIQTNYGRRLVGSRVKIYYNRLNLVFIQEVVKYFNLIYKPL